MVGVAGKSKSCSTCKKRKIRCDLQIPSCGQCLKTGRECEGYDKPTVFVNTACQEYARDGRPRALHHDAPSQPYQCEGQSSEAAKPTFIKRKTAMRHQSKNQSTAGVTSHLISLSEIDDTAVWHDQALAVFIESSGIGLVSEEIPLSWLKSAAAMPKQTKAFPLITSALSCGWLGQIERQQDITHKSLMLYSTALRSMRDDLNHPKQREEVEIFAAMVTLALYEMLQFGIEVSNGWSTHIQGIERFMQSRGSQMHTAGLNRQLFLFYRVIAVLHALEHRKATFLATPEWKHIPWTLNPKDLFHQSLDLASEVPALLQQVDNLNPTSPTSLCDKLRNDCISLITGFQQWEVNAGFSFQDNTSNSSLTHSHHGYPSTTPHLLSLSPSRLHTSRLLLFHYSTLLAVYMTLISSPFLSSEPGEAFPEPSEGSPELSVGVTSPPPLAFGAYLSSKILEHIDVAAQDAWRSFGPAIAIYSLKVALMWYELSEGKGWGKKNDMKREEELRKCRGGLRMLRMQTSP